MYIIILKLEKQTFSKLVSYAKLPTELKEKTTINDFHLSCCGHLACNWDHFIILLLIKYATNPLKLLGNFHKTSMTDYSVTTPRFSVEKLISNTSLRATNCFYLVHTT